MTIPTVRDWSATELITEAKLDEISAALNYLLAPPRCFAYKGSDGSLGNNVWSGGISLGVEAYDSSNMHDNTTNNSRVAAPETGLYEAKASIEFEFHATGSRRLQVRKNAAGDQTLGTLLRYKTVNAVAGAGNNTSIDATFEIQLTAGDYLEMFAHQTSGGPLNVLGTIAGTFLSMRWVARTV